MANNFSWDSTEVRLLVVFLLVFTLFAHWGGDNAWSRYDLTQSIVEDNSVDISGYSHNTMDKMISSTQVYKIVNSSDFNRSNLTQLGKAKETAIKQVLENSEHPVYTDKAPLSSFIAIPGYILGDILAGSSTSPESWIDNPVTDTPIELSFQTSLKQLLIVLTTSVVFGALTILLIYRHVERLEDRETALYTALIAGFATPLFFYSTSFFGVINAAFFSFLSYLLLDTEKLNKQKAVFLAGITSALALSTEYYSIFIALVLVTYLIFSGRKDEILRFSGGFLVGALPLFFYHWLITGNPLIPAIGTSTLMAPGPINTVCSLYQVCLSPLSYPVVLGSILDPVRTLNNMFRLLFFQSRGLFFYSPILLLSIPGIYEIYKKDRKLLTVFPGAFFLLLAFQASRVNWLSGINFGPRYMIVGLPFLIIPTAIGLKKFMEKGRIWHIFIALIFLFSSFNMLLAFNAVDFEVDRKDYSDRYNSFSAVQNDLYSRMQEEFVRYGSRSEVLMSLTDRYKGLDITYRSPYGLESIELRELNGEALLFSTNLVPVILSLMLIITAFYPELGSLRIPGVLLLFFLIAISFSTSSIFHAEETYRADNYTGAVNNSLQTTFYLENKSQIPYLEARAYLGNETQRQVKYSLNGQVRRQNLSTYRPFYFPFNTQEGKNTVKLETSGCEVPGLHENDSDPRCLSIIARNFSVQKPEDVPQPLLLSGWYSAELSGDGVWMAEDSQLRFQSEETGYKLLRINLTRNEHLNKSNLTLKVNNKTVKTINQTKSETTIITPFNARKGWNNLKITSNKCTKPSKHSNSTDNRCLSYKLQNISFDESNASNRIYYSGWEEQGKSRWIAKKSQILFNSPKKGYKLLKINLTRNKYLNESSLAIKLNNKTIKSINQTKPDTTLITPVGARKGWNNLEILSEKCVRPSKHSKSTDDRCLSFRLENVSLVSSESTEQIYFQDWYKKVDKGRWMAKNSRISFNSAERGYKFLKLDLTHNSRIKENKMSLRVNNNSLKRIKNISRETKIEIPIQVRKGWNNLEIMSDKCIRPSSYSDSTDDRCLSFKLENISFKSSKNFSNRIYYSGWYEGGTKRWMSDKGVIFFKSNESKDFIGLDLEPYMPLLPNSVAINLNDRNVRNITVNRTEKIWIPGKILEGLNKLTLESQNGCRRPAEIEKNSTDERCISLHLQNLSFSNPPRTTLIETGLYEEKNLITRYNSFQISSK